jgi:hypothetical protein
VTHSTQTTANQEHGDLRAGVAAFDQPGTMSARQPPLSGPSSGPSSGNGQATLFEEVIGAVQRNPVLAIGTVAVLSAITVMALKPSRTPQTKLRALERRAMRQITDAEKQLKSALDRSGVSSSLENIAGTVTARLAALDANQLEPLKQRATAVFNQTLDRLGTMMK